MKVRSSTVTGWIVFKTKNQLSALLKWLIVLAVRAWWRMQL